MQKYSLRHVENDVLLRDLNELVAKDRSTTASLLAHIAEVKERRLYRDAGQPNMHAYCVNVLRFSEDAAHKRLQAAGAARRFPVIFEALADGRLHLSGVCLLAPHLLPENADELISSAMNKTKAEVESAIAHRFPQADLPELVQAIAVASAPTAEEPKTAPGQFFETPSNALTRSESATAPAHTIAPLEYPRVKPLAPQRYGLQVTLDERTHNLLREAQDLLGHTEGGGQISNVLTRALELLVRQLKQRKFAETERPKRSSRKPKSVRTIPAEVKRAVRARDEGRCTFANSAGERCPARTRLEYDHKKPVAQGGESTVENVRLRCRAHNQLAAEQAFREEFMHDKRMKPKCVPEAKATPPIEAHAQAAIHEKAYELIPWLRDRSGTPPAISQAPASSG